VVIIPKNNWHEKFAGLGAREAKRLRELEIETDKRKKLLAERLLENEAMNDFLSKKWYSPLVVLRS
jgi:putative transposase